MTSVMPINDSVFSAHFTSPLSLNSSNISGSNRTDRVEAVNIANSLANSTEVKDLLYQKDESRSNAEVLSSATTVTNSVIPTTTTSSLKGNALTAVSPTTVIATHSTNSAVRASDSCEKGKVLDAQKSVSFTFTLPSSNPSVSVKPKGIFMKVSILGSK